MGKQIKTGDASFPKITNNKFVVDGTFTSRRKHPKRNTKISSKGAGEGQKANVKKAPIVIEEKRKTDLAVGKEIRPVLPEEGQHSNKKQILWKTENIAHLELGGATIGDFRDETLEEKHSESEGDSNIETQTSTDISKIENIHKFA